MADPSGSDERVSDAPALEQRWDNGTLQVIVRGDWRAESGQPPTTDDRLPGYGQRVEIILAPTFKPHARALAGLRRLLLVANQSGASADLSKLPADLRQLLELSLAVPAQETHPAGPTLPLIERIGTYMLAMVLRQRRILAFVGDTAQGIAALATGRARYRGADFWLTLQDVGARALPIVSVVAFLFGSVLAFIGSLQLRPFGAQIFVANLVGSGLALEMGGLITAVVMAGRAGAAFAAQIGAMQGNEEVDALRTAGFSPTEFLVVPRVVALGLMTPLLTLYADAVGIVGGMVVGVTMLDISVAAYWTQTLQYLSPDQFAKGLGKSFVFGILIAMAGCLRGMQCGRSAQAVGEATTSAVVTSIVAIVVADAIITVLIFKLDL